MASTLISLFLCWPIYILTFKNNPQDMINWTVLFLKYGTTRYDGQFRNLEFPRRPRNGVCHLKYEKVALAAQKIIKYFTIYSFAPILVFELLALLRNVLAKPLFIKYVYNI